MNYSQFKVMVQVFYKNFMCDKNNAIGEFLPFIREIYDTIIKKNIEEVNS